MLKKNKMKINREIEFPLIKSLRITKMLILLLLIYSYNAIPIKIKIGTCGQAILQG